MSEDHELSRLAIKYNDNICFIVQEVGAAWGYARKGQVLSGLVRGVWKKNFTINRHLLILEGNDLRLFKEFLHNLQYWWDTKNKVSNTRVHSKTTSIHLFTTEGLALAASLSNKPKAVEFNKQIQQHTTRRR